MYTYLKLFRYENPAQPGFTLEKRTNETKTQHESDTVMQVGKWERHSNASWERVVHDSVSLTNKHLRSMTDNGYYISLIS